MFSNNEIILRIISANLIPWAITLAAVFSDLFSSIFIRKEEVQNEYKSHINYLIIGQAVFISPLAALINILDYLLFETSYRNGLNILIISLYILLYLFFLIIYLRMGADKFDRQVLLVKGFYKIAPAVIVTLTVILTIVSTSNQ